MTNKIKIDFMDEALKQARKALASNEVPIGAVVVDGSGTIIGRGYNKTETKGCQRFHAEMIAIEQACKKMGDWRLNGCWIYVTLEPCLMCFGFVQLSRLSGIVYGAPSSLYGVGLGKALEHVPSYAKGIAVESGVKQDESLDLLKLFFVQARKMRKVLCETKN